MKLKAQTLVLGLAIFVGAVVIGCGGSGTAFPPAYKVSVNRVTRLTKGILMYASDYDDFLPLAHRWHEGTMPYVKDEANYHSPALGQNPALFGYAFNIDLAGQSVSARAPGTTPLVFDSTDLSDNATASVSTMPNPPRYIRRNTIGYVNGTVQDGYLADGDTPPTPYEVSQSRMRQLATGLAMYSSDYDDYLPPSNRWMDGIFPYTKSETLFHSPALANNPSAYGYALNIDIAGHSFFEFEAPATTLSLFDSTVLTRNATAATTTEPNPPRYPQGNTEAFLDGHVK